MFKNLLFQNLKDSNFTVLGFEIAKLWFIASGDQGCCCSFKLCHVRLKITIYLIKCLSSSSNFGRPNVCLKSDCSISNLPCFISVFFFPSKVTAHLKFWSGLRDVVPQVIFHHFRLCLTPLLVTFFFRTDPVLFVEDHL